MQARTATAATKFFVALYIAIMPGTLLGQRDSATQHVDFTAKAKSQFPYRTAISGAMALYGVAGLMSNPIKDVNKNALEAFGKPLSSSRTHIDNVLPVIPMAGLYAARLVGVQGEHTIRQTLLIHGMALIIGNVVVNATKLMNLEWRPDSSSKHSFPSAHTANAFLTAEIIRRELRGASPWYGVGAYTLAAATGYLRMYNRKHWLSDVIAGAGTGILSAQLAYVIFDGLHKRRRREGSTTLMAVPYYQSASAGVSVYVVLN